jgi:hypothetical protein
MSSYQKLKNKNIALKEQIRILINEPNSIKAMEIKHIYKTQKGLIDAVWFGQYNNKQRKGLYNIMK